MQVMSILYLTIIKSSVNGLGFCTFINTDFPCPQVALKRRTTAIKKKKEIFKRAEAYVKEYRIKERDEIRLARQVSFFFISVSVNILCIFLYRGKVLC